MKPLSALYYIKGNKARSGIVIFLLFFTTLLFLGGNYVYSVFYYWKGAIEYSDRCCKVSAITTDEEFKDYYAFREKVLKDDSLIVLERTPQGYPGLPVTCTMGFEIGSDSMVFQTVDDLKILFDEMNVDADLSDMKDGSVCISSAVAKQYNLKKGDVLDASVNKNINGTYAIDAIVDDGSYSVFYVQYSDEPLRMNILSRNISGDELVDYLKNIQGDYKLKIDRPIKYYVEEEFAPFSIVFGVGIALLSLVLAIIVNSVITGQFISRTYEFGVYRAIGLSKKEIYKKCGAELLGMDIIAIVIGAATIFLGTFLANELYYMPKGQYLPYYSNMGLYSFVASNLFVIIPTIMLKGRAMSKADVTEF